jgi:hypothetical protein
MVALHDFVWLLIPITTIALCYGGGFGTMPAFVADIFGAKNSGTLYGAMLTAWSAGAVAGPLLIAALPYRTALMLIAVLLIAALPLRIMFHTLARRGKSGIAVGSPFAGALQPRINLRHPESRLCNRFRIHAI